MDEMRIRSKFLKKLISKYITKTIKKKVPGSSVFMEFLEIESNDGQKVVGRVTLSFETDMGEIEKILFKEDLND